MEDLNVIKVAKVANPDIRKTTEDSRNLPKMPRLYLELIENKDKIKQHILNKEYDPDDTTSEISFFGGETRERNVNVMSDIEEESDINSDQSSVEENSVKSVASSISDRKPKTHRKYDETDDETEEEATDKDDVSGNDDDDDDDDDDEDDDDVDQSGGSGDDDRRRKYDEQRHHHHQRDMSKSQKYAKILNENLPPKLSDLERQGEIRNKQSIPNLDRMYATEEEEDEMKRELLFKFELLKKAYKTDVPEFNIHSDLKHMSRSYESTLRRVSLDSSVENYKQLLIGGFMVLEFILGYLFKFDMQGFTQQQILNMNQYERLLIELGENSYVPGGSQWPVEVRLLLMVLGNAAIFIIAKMIMKKTGSNLMGMMNTFAQPTPTQKRKMRGPSINPDDIPDISSSDTGVDGY